MTNMQDYKNKWYILFSVGMGVFLATIDASIVNIALPTLVKSFNTKFAVVQWAALSYMLTIATLILSMGRLGDMRGKKKIYLSGMIIFTSGSVLCGLSQTVYWLIFFRVIQGIGASMMASLGAALVTEAFPDQERGKALGSIGGIVAVGIITGPVLGGILIDALSWHWIFFVNIPVGIAGSLMILKFVPEQHSAQDQKFDFAGAGFMFVSILCFLLALTVGQSLGFLNPWIILLFSLWIISFVIFFFIELKVKQPMLDLHIFRNRLFSLNLFSGFMSFVGTAGVVILMPFYLENVLGYSPHEVGFLLATVPLSAGFVSPLAGSLSDRFGTRIISIIGLFLLAAGYYSLSTLSETTTSLGYILRFLPVGLGIGIFQSPNNSSIMGAAPKKYLGIVSGLLSISRTLGQTAGIAAIGAFWAARVAFYAGTTSAAEPTRAEITAQVHGLDDALMAIVFVIGLVLILNIWEFSASRIKKV
jgi:EmrB/QacA subfamily drug resistance transporter